MIKCNMWCLLWTLGLVLQVSSLPQNPTTARAIQNNEEIDETLKHITNQLMEVNATSQITFDTRTPPKVKQQLKEKILDAYESSHPGIAEPVDEESMILEEETKKMNFYKIEKSTTDSGLSTWILLSGQTQAIDKPTKKPLVKNVTNTFIDDNNNKVVKPLFKRKSTTTTPLSTKSITTITTPKTLTTTEHIEKTTKLNNSRTKASTVPNKSTAHYITKKTTASKPTTVAKTTTASKSTTATKSTTASKPTTVSKSVVTERTTTKVTKPISSTIKVKSSTETIKTGTKANSRNETIESNSVLSPEAKLGDLDLSTTTQQSKKKRVTATLSPLAKRKKNKHRRKRPTADDKMDTITNKLSTKHKEKPIGTQIYNYLSREVMPTVGVGLVGLMVTAGLASYFLYPFGPLRRSYEVIDRKDKEPTYHYNNEYSGGMAEEEAIGKVIAGMPANSNLNTRVKNSRNTYMNRYRNVDQRYSQGTVENVQLSPKKAYTNNNNNNEEVIMGSPKKNYNHKEVYDSYTNLMFDKKKSIGEEKKFVVGNVPKDFQDANDVGIPSVVPEHGPRNIEQKENVFIVESISATDIPLSDSIKVEHGPRRRRQVNEKDNEIDSDDKQQVLETTITISGTTTPATISTTTTKGNKTTVHPIIEKTESLFDLIKDLFVYKLRLGLQLLQNKADSLSRYFKTVQARIDDSYKEAQKQSYL